MPKIVFTVGIRWLPDLIPPKLDVSSVLPALLSSVFGTLIEFCDIHFQFYLSMCWTVDFEISLLICVLEPINRRVGPQFGTSIALRDACPSTQYNAPILLV